MHMMHAETPQQIGLCYASCAVSTRIRQLVDSVLGFAVTSRTVVIEDNSGLQWNRLLLITYSNRNITHSKISDRNIVHSKILDRNIISRTA